MAAFVLYFPLLDLISSDRWLAKAKQSDEVNSGSDIIIKTGIKKAILGANLSL